MLLLFSKCSKQLFDYGVGVQRRKEGFLKKEKILAELSRAQRSTMGKKIW